jgi:Xaa-Pro aminopeptidase
MTSPFNSASTLQFIDARRRAAVAAFGSSAPAVVIAAGQPISKPGGHDQTYPFIPHPNYYWLTNSRRWGNVLAWDQDTGWRHFVRPVDTAERLWEGGENDELPADAVDVMELDAWLAARAAKPIAVLGAPLSNDTGKIRVPQHLENLRDGLEAVRRPKDALELALVERATAATAAGFARARKLIVPRATEREIQIELEAEMFRHGADGLGYDSIVGIGHRSAILHSTPNNTRATEDDLVLIDAGGAVRGYTADVTRTYSVGERFTPEAQAIYDIVLAAQCAAIDACRVGVEWHAVHRIAARALAEGLRHHGILRISADEACDGEAIALFLPHGIGHMLGLGVRDVGGRVAGREEGRMCCGAKVRVDLPLQENYLMTVEPGLYFVPAILDDPARREKFRAAVAWDDLARWRSIGGVRIEDNILVTTAGPKNLTSKIPK